MSYFKKIIKNMNRERWIIWSFFFIIGIPLSIVSPPNGVGMMLAGVMVLFLVGTESE